jgi:serine/threonine protein kinase
MLTSIASVSMAQALPRMRMALPRVRVSHTPWKDAKIKFKRLRMIGRGSYGEVYSAVYGKTPIIIKHAVPMPGAVTTRDAFDALKHEIVILGKLQKFPFAPRLIEVGPDYFVQEDVQGEAMMKILANKGLEAREILSTAVAAGTILSIMHREGIAHRDVASRNILLTPSGVVLIDFGLSIHRSQDEAKWKDGIKDDIGALLAFVELAASGSDVPHSARAVLNGIISKFKRRLDSGEYDENTASALSKELFFVTAQLGARYQRGRTKIAMEKIRVALI